MVCMTDAGQAEMSEKNNYLNRSWRRVSGVGVRRIAGQLLPAGVAAAVVIVIIQGALLISSAGASHGGTTVLVDASDSTSDAGGCGDVANPCETIQAAVDHAAPGDTLSIAAGTYVEQVEIDKALTLDGGSKELVVIESPDTLTEKFTTVADNYPIVFVHDTDGVTIRDLTVDGGGKGNANFRFIGIGYSDASGTVEGVRVTGVRETPISGNQHGVGIFAFAASGTPRTIAVTNSQVDDYQKSGLVLAGANLTATVKGNTVVGAGPTEFIEQSGIQAGFGAGGSITGNEISLHDFIPGTLAATAILIFEAAPGMDVLTNDVHDNMEGVLIHSSDDVTVEANTVADIEGVAVFAFLSDGGTYAANSLTNNAVGLWNADSSNVAITGNIIDANNHGLVIDGASINVQVIGNEITNNTANSSGIHVQAFESASPSNIGAHFNLIAGNGTSGGYGVFNETTNDINATNNWWGAVDGPSGVAPGSGDPVTEHVIYDPWLLSEAAVGDTDGDGCRDEQENGPDEKLGGRRDPQYYWDFMDMWVNKQKDRRVNIIDVAALVQRFGGVGDLNGDPLDPPQALTGYHVSADRSPPIGPNPWNAGPPDGDINIIEIGLVVVQFGHTCA